MNLLSTIIVFLTFLANIVIFFVVFFNNYRSWTNRLIALLAIIFASWTLTNYFALSPGSEEQRLFWVRVVMVVTAPMGIATFLLAKVFPGEKLAVSRKTLVISLMLVVLAIALTPYMFVELTNLEDGNFSLKPGFGIILFAINHLGLTTAGLVVLIIKYKRSSGLLKKQLTYFLFGLVTTLTMITISNFLAVVLFGTIQYTFIGPTFTLILVGLMTYSIVRHQFLDVRLLVARTVSYTILFLVIISSYAVVLFALTETIPTNINRDYLAVGLALIIAFSYNPIRLLLEKITDKIFFKGRYDTEKLLSELTHIMASEIIIKELSEKLLHTLTARMRLTRSAFALVQGNALKIVHSEGSKWDEALSNPELMALYREQKDIFIFEELAAGNIKTIFRDLSISVALPLKVGQENIGILILGPKASGDIYNSQDIEFLEILAPQAAIALKNAQSYRAIQEFTHTLEKKVEERTAELRETQKSELAKAKELLRLKDEFVFIATHDLRTPVTAISGFVELIKGHSDEFSKEILDDFQSIEEGSRRLNKLVDDLLEVARSESGAIKVDLKPVDIIKIIKDIVNEVAPSAKEKDVVFETSFEDPVVSVMADEQKLSEVMENLLSNAIKYNKDGGKVSVNTVKKGDALEVVVSDTGLGIPADKQAQVFQKFFRAQQSGTEGVSGTGLGLFVVRMLIEKMGGTISFKSVEGEGTTFIFTIPLAKHG